MIAHHRDINANILKSVQRIFSNQKNGARFWLRFSILFGCTYILIYMSRVSYQAYSWNYVYRERVCGCHSAIWWWLLLLYREVCLPLLLLWFSFVHSALSGKDPGIIDYNNVYLHYIINLNTRPNKQKKIIFYANIWVTD